MATKFEISGTIFKQTDKAIQLGIDATFFAGGGMVENAEILWIPKSQIQEFTRHEGDGYSCIIPGWMAYRNGLSNHPQAIFGNKVENAKA